MKNFVEDARKIREKNKITYKRVLLKMSGEYFAGSKEFGFDEKTFKQVAKQIKKIYLLGVEMAIVIGGGNIARGKSLTNVLDPVNADSIGMLATMMNCIYLQNILEDLDLKTRLMSAISIPNMAEPYIVRRAKRHLEKGRIVLIGAGTGNPFFTTDTAAVLRSREINADIVIKCTNVDGIYDKDPNKYQDAKKFSNLNFEQALVNNLKIMDSTAFSFSKTNNLNIYVLDIRKPDALSEFLTGNGQGTLVGN